MVLAGRPSESQLQKLLRAEALSISCNLTLLPTIEGMARGLEWTESIRLPVVPVVKFRPRHPLIDRHSGPLPRVFEAG